MVELEFVILDTKKYIEIINITTMVEDLVNKSKINNGMALVTTMHTTTGITINESLECLQRDIEAMLNRLVPEDYPYNHARMLHSYGTTAGNPTGHLKSLITGNQVLIPVLDGKLVRGSAQDIFFCEFDGAQRRKIVVQIIGE